MKTKKEYQEALEKINNKLKQTSYELEILYFELECLYKNYFDMNIMEQFINRKQYKNEKEILLKNIQELNEIYKYDNYVVVDDCCVDFIKENDTKETKEVKNFIFKRSY